MCAQRVKLIYIQERRWQTQQQPSSIFRKSTPWPAREIERNYATDYNPEPSSKLNIILWIHKYAVLCFSSVLYSTGIAYIVVNIAAHPFCAPPRQRTHWRHGKEDCIRVMRTLLRIHTHTVHRSPCRTDLICDLDAALSARKLLCNFVYCVLWNNI